MSMAHLTKKADFLALIFALLISVKKATSQHRTNCGNSAIG
ncbi:hypothetical protein Citrof4_122 [Citrobacter phage Citrof4]